MTPSKPSDVSEVESAREFAERLLDSCSSGHSHYYDAATTLLESRDARIRAEALEPFRKKAERWHRLARATASAPMADERDCRESATLRDCANELLALLPPAAGKDPSDG